MHESERTLQSIELVSKPSSLLHTAECACALDATNPTPCSCVSITLTVGVTMTMDSVEQASHLELLDSLSLKLRETVGQLGFSYCAGTAIAQSTYWAR